MFAEVLLHSLGGTGVLADSFDCIEVSRHFNLEGVSLVLDFTLTVALHWYGILILLLCRFEASIVVLL